MRHFLGAPAGAMLAGQALAPISPAALVDDSLTAPLCASAAACDAAPATDAPSGLAADRSNKEYLCGLAGGVGGSSDSL